MQKYCVSKSCCWCNIIDYINCFGMFYFLLIKCQDFSCKVLALLAAKIIIMDLSRCVHTKINWSLTNRWKNCAAVIKLASQCNALVSCQKTYKHVVIFSKATLNFSSHHLLLRKYFIAFIVFKKYIFWLVVVSIFLELSSHYLIPRHKMS